MPAIDEPQQSRRRRVSHKKAAEGSSGAPRATGDQAGSSGAPRAAGDQAGSPGGAKSPRELQDLIEKRKCEIKRLEQKRRNLDIRLVKKRRDLRHLSAAMQVIEEQRHKKDSKTAGSGAACSGDVLALMDTSHFEAEQDALAAADAIVQDVPEVIPQEIRDMTPKNPEYRRARRNLEQQLKLLGKALPKSRFYRSYVEKMVMKIRAAGSD